MLFENTSSIIDDNNDIYKLDTKKNIKEQLIILARSESDEYIYEFYSKNKNIILSSKFAEKNAYSLLSELCRKSKYNVLEILFKEMNKDVKNIKVKSIKNLLQNSYSLLNNAVWLSKSDIKILEEEKEEWIHKKIDDIIKTIIVIINEYSSEIIFTKKIIETDKNKQTQIRLVKESFFEALLDPLNGYNNDNNYTYSHIIYDNLTRNFSEICKLINPEKFKYMISVITNKISINSDIKEHTKYYNDWYCFLMTHFTNNFLIKLINDCIILTSYSVQSEKDFDEQKEDSSINKFINMIFLKPTIIFKRYFNYFYESESKKNQYYLNIVKFIINDVYKLYLEAIKLYNKEIDECIKFEKEGESIDIIKEKIKILRNENIHKNSSNIFYFDILDNDKYQIDDFIKDEIKKHELLSDKLNCVYRYSIDRISKNFHRVFGSFYKNNFLKEDIINIIMKNNFKYTNINMMITFVKYSNIRWDDNCNYHKKMMMLFKKKKEEFLNLDKKLTLQQNKFILLFNIYNDNYYNKNININLSLVNEVSDFIPIKDNSLLIKSTSFDGLSTSNDLRILTQTPIFNKKNFIISPAISSSPIFFEDFPLPDETLLKYIKKYYINYQYNQNNKDYEENKDNQDKILDYLYKNKNLISKDIIIVTFLRSLVDIKFDDLILMSEIIQKVNNIIKIDMSIINDIFKKYIEFEDDLKIDNVNLTNQLNIIFRT